MKSVVISVLLLSMSLFFVSCENEGQLTESASDVETQILDKKPHDGDLITFTGDLVGSATVMGCCPNAGPFPAYNELTLSGSLPAGIYDGHIFMNKVGRRTNQSYMVQFWTETMFLEVRGGVIQEDKKNKSLTATFTLAPWTINGESTYVDVTFTLTRAQQ